MAISDHGNVATTEAPIRRTSIKMADPTKGAFFWLSAFFVVYCTRFQDFIPGMQYLPVAKVPAILAMWGLFNSLGKTKRTFKDIPKMANLLLYMILLLYVGAFLSPIWRGGALIRTIDFSKIYICWVLVFLLVTTFARLKRIIFIQAFSVVMVCIAVIIKGYDVPRLDSVLGGFYSNPNDLAFAVVLSLPYALAFFVVVKNGLAKAFWFVGMMLMLAVIFLTASRAGFIDLVCSYSVALYFIAIKGKRFWLIVASAVLGLVIVSTVGGRLYDRFNALSGDSAVERGAYGSFQDRKFLMVRALEGIEHYPLLGLGCRNFETYSRHLARSAHDLPPDRRRRRRAGADSLLDVFSAGLPEYSCAHKNEESRSRRQAICRSLDRFPGRLRRGGVVCAGSLPILPLFCHGLYSHFVTNDERAAERQRRHGAPAAEKAASLPGGLCRPRNHRYSLPCPLTCWQFCVA